MKQKYKIFLLRQVNGDYIYDQPFKLTEPPGYLGGVEFDTKEEAAKELTEGNIWGENYTILELFRKE